MGTQELLALERKMDRLAGPAAGASYRVHLVDGECRIQAGSASLYVHECDNFCLDCADLLAALLTRAGVDRDDARGVFPVVNETDAEDTPDCCGWCGSLIEYNLSSFGVIAALESLGSRPADKPFAASEAYMLARTVGFVHDELAGGDGLDGDYAEEIEAVLDAVERLRPAIENTFGDSLSAAESTLPSPA